MSRAAVCYFLWLFMKTSYFFVIFRWTKQKKTLKINKYVNEKKRSSQISAYKNQVSIRMIIKKYIFFLMRKMLLIKHRTVHSFVKSLREAEIDNFFPFWFFVIVPVVFFCASFPILETYWLLWKCHARNDVLWCDE